MIFYSKDAAKLIKLRIMRWRDYPGLSGWALKANTSYKIEMEENLTRTEEEVQCGQGGHDWNDAGANQARSAWNPQQLGEERGRFFPRASRESTALSPGFQPK